MARSLRTAFALAVLVLASRPLFGHLSFNLVVDGDANVYFIDVFKSTLLKVSSEGEVSVLAELRAFEPDGRLHSVTRGPEGNLYLAGHHSRKIWSVSPAGEVLGFDLHGAPEQSVRGVLHLDFDPGADPIVVDWVYGATRENQRFEILRFADFEEEPAILLEIEGSDDDFLDFHLGSLLFADDGVIYCSNPHGIWTLRAGGRPSLLAGGAEAGFSDGAGTEARFDRPHGICAHPDGGILVAERSGRLRRVTASGDVTTLAGSGEQGHADGTLAQARFSEAFAVAVGPGGNVYVAEYESRREYRIRVLTEERVITLSRISTDGVFAK